MPAKTEDQIAIEKIVAQDMRENPTPEPPGEAIVREQIERKMAEQKRLNEAEAKGRIPPAAVERMASYVERKARR